MENSHKERIEIQSRLLFFFSINYLSSIGYFINLLTVAPNSQSMNERASDNEPMCINEESNEMTFVDNE